jgi:flagellar basal-body rod modification protein FlgD
MAEINPASTATTTPSAASVNRFSEMSSEDFIKIIFTELTNQDPFQPNDSNALLQQLNSIRSIESDMAMTDKLDALVRDNQLAGASNMIGKYVSGLSDANDPVSGIVVAVVREGDAIKVELDSGYRVPVGSIKEVIDIGQLQQLQAAAAAQSS